MAKSRNRRAVQFYQPSLQTQFNTLIESLEGRLLLCGTINNFQFKPTFVARHASLGAAVFANAVTSASTPHAAKSNATAASAPYSPAQVESAYGTNEISFGGLTGNGAGQTIAIVDAYNDPNIVSDAATFDSQWGLQQFNVAGGPTLQVLNQNGQTTSLPANSSAGGWDVEESLDVEWAHSIAPDANIDLFEANSAGGDLFTAVAKAASTSGVSVVSMSWGGGEFSGEQSYDSYFTTPAGHQGVTFLASTGDSAAPAGYPAYSPNVVAVGGTSLTINTDGTWGGETGWTDSGGGISTQEAQPSYQTGKVNGISSTNRTAPDVSAIADPNTGVYVYDSYAGGWYAVGGTSLASPVWAGLVAIADQGRVANGMGTLDGRSQTLPAIYNLPATDFHDITSGNNGYAAGAGYDLVTGRGSPIANTLVPDLAGISQNAQNPTAKIAFGVEPSNVVAGQAIAPSVTVDVENASGTIVTTDSSTITISTNTGPGSVGGIVTAQAVNGVATFTGLTLNTAGGYTLKASDGSLTGTTSSGLTVSPATANKLGFVQQPTNVTTGVTMAPAVTVDVLDKYGNVVTTDTSSVTLATATGPGALGGTTSVNAVNGIATFANLSLATVGTSYTLAATDPGLAGTTSGSFNVTAPTGTAAKLVITKQPGTSVAGKAIAPSIVVTIEDANGNVVTSNTSSVTLAVASGPGSLGGTFMVNAVNGVATFTNAILTKAGSYQLTASDGVLTSATTSSFSVTAAAASKLVFQTVPSHVTHGVVMSPATVVDIEDAYGNIVTGNNSRVTLTINTGPRTGGSVSVNAVNGVATFSNLVISTAGTYTLAASDGSLSRAISGSIVVS